MTALVSLLFIAMIPTDCEVTNFPYSCSNKKYKSKDSHLHLQIF